MKLSLIAAALVLTISACDSSPKMIYSSKYSTINTCIVGIVKNSGQQLKVYTDKPSEVSGKLSDGRYFGCHVKQSGTLGTYVEGWYDQT